MRSPGWSRACGCPTASVCAAIRVRPIDRKDSRSLAFVLLFEERSCPILRLQGIWAMRIRRATVAADALPTSAEIEAAVREMDHAQIDCCQQLGSVGRDFLQRAGLPGRQEGDRRGAARDERHPGSERGTDRKRTRLNSTHGYN